MRALAVLAAGLLLAAPAVARAAPTLRDLVEVADLDCLTLSPDGRVAVVREVRADIATNRTLVTWWAVDSAGRQAPVRIAAGGEAMFYGGYRTPEIVRWSADSRWFYFRALIDGQVQVWRARADGGRTEQVTHDDADVTDFQLEPGSSDLTYRTGKSRAAVMAAEQAEYDSGILVDYSIDPGQSAFRGMMINGRLASERLSGAWFSRRGLLADQPLHVRRIHDGVTQELPRRDQAQLAAAGPPPPTSKSPEGLIGFAKPVGQRQRPAVRSPRGDETLCELAACEVSDLPAFNWQAGGKELIFLARLEDRTSALMGWSPGAKRLRRILSYQGTLGGGDYLHRECAFVGERALCVAAATVEPPRLVTIDLKSGQMATLLDPSALERSRLTMKTRSIHWSAAGHDFHGVLYLPEGAQRDQPAPLFIQYYYCDGYLRGGTGDEYPMAVLAAKGVAALCINATRRHGERDEDYDAIANYDLADAGIRTIIGELGRSGIVDPGRVGMGGLSFGSEVVMRTLVRTDLLRAAAISSGEIEPIYFWHYLHGRDFLKRVRSTWGLGAPEETPARWKEVSPALNAERINAPLLMQMPEQESRNNYELLGRLSLRTVPAEMFLFPEEAHMKYQPRHKLAVYERNLDWFRFWLGGVVDTDPAKKAQFERWQGMQKAWQPASTPAEKEQRQDR